MNLIENSLIYSEYITNSEKENRKIYIRRIYLLDGKKEEQKSSKSVIYNLISSASNNPLQRFIYVLLFFSSMLLNVFLKPAFYFFYK